MSSSSGSAPPKKPQKKREQSASSHSALLDTPSGQDLGKTRTYVACKSCRTKKIKCLPGPTLSASASLADGAPAFGTCQQCLQSNSECVYPATRDRAAYSRQYVQNLESRVQALEQLSGRLGPLLEAYERGALADLIPDSARHDDTAASADVRRANGLPSDARPDETDGAAGDETVDSGVGEDGDDADEEITGQLTQDDRGNYRWIGSSNTLSLLGEFHPQPHRNNSGHSQKSLQQAVGEDGVGAEPEDGDGGDESGGKVIFGPVAGSGVVMALPSVDEVNYPPPEAAEAMVEAFFHEVYPVLPLVLEYEFREEFAELMRRRKAGILETMDKGFVSVVFAIFALGERVLVSSAAWHRERAKWNSGSGPSQAETILPGEAEAGVVWYERAEILHYSTVRDVTIRQVQCLTLLAAFQASVNAMPMAWLLAGQALRIGQDIGLPRATTFAMTLEQRQVAHRCWWSIYGLERLVSIALGRPLGVDDLDVDISYPLNVDDETLHRLSQQGLTQPPATYEEPPESTMSGFIALTKLCKIAGRVGQLLYRPSHGRSVADPKWAESQQASITKLHKAIRDWLAHDVPPKYKDPAASRPVQLVAATLSNCYFSILITLHRNFLPPSRDFPRPRPPPSSESLKHCVDAARSVIHVAAQSRVIVPPSHHLALFCQFLWSSAVILLLCEVQARDHVIEEAVAGQVESCRRVLQALEPVWPGSRKLKELLNDVETRAKEVVEAKENGEVADAPDTKKRKSISRDPPVKPRPSSAMGARPVGRASSDASASPSSHDKRPRLHPTNTAGRYEISSMRDHPTSLAATSEATMPPYSAPLPSTVSVHPSAPQSYMSSPGFQGQPSANNGAFNFGSSTPSGTTSNQFSAVAGTPGMGFGLDSFDLGGVTFDGLEMLQGFSGMDTASIWQAMSAAFLTDPQPTPGATTSYLHPSNHSTPASVSGSVSGSATANAGSMQPPTTPGHAQGTLGQPIASHGAPTPLWQHGAPGNPSGGWFMPGQGPRVGGGEGGAPGDGEWSQVAGNTFDWGADPTVPFNI